MKSRKTCFSYARVSSGNQATEDKTGIERQLETARKVAREKGWTLDEKLSISDPGTSGLRGKNVSDTAKLGMLLKDIKDGKIAPNQIMIVEAFDRLTRQELHKALNLLQDILEMGLEIYIDRGGRYYTKESLNNPIDLIIAIVELAAGHEYSAKLGERVSRAWAIKKKRLVQDGKPYKSKPPGWLRWHKISDTEGYYEVIPEKVKSVKRLFELANQGIGVRGIAKRMNNEGTPVIGNYAGKKIKSKQWSPSSVTKILRRKTVLGFNMNLQPPVLMYPAVIDEKAFYTAQAKNDEHRTHKYFGRSSDKPQSLFAGLAECSKCGNSMNVYRQKAPVTPNSGSKGGKADYMYLRCEGVLNGVCSDSMMRYDKLEESFATMLSGSAFVNAYAETRPEQINTIELIQGKIVDTHSRLERYITDYEKQPSDVLLNLMAKTENEEKSLREEMEQIKTASVGSSPITDMRNELLAILYKGWYDVDVRLKLRELIRAVVNKIIINGRARSYTVHWKNKDKPTQVEVFGKAYKIDGMMMMASPHWEQDIIKAGEVIRQLEGKPQTITEPVDTTKEPVEVNTLKAILKPQRKHTELQPLKDKEAV